MLISTVTGGAVGIEQAGNAEYWRRQVRDGVHFHTAIQTLSAQGCTAFVEIGPGSTLLGMGKEIIGRDGQLWTPSIRRSKHDSDQMAESLAELYVRGVPVDWNAYEAGRGRLRVALPGYPFERQPYRLETHAGRTADPETSWNAIRESMQRQSGQGRLDLDVSSYPRRWEHMDRLTGAFIRSTLRDLQIFAIPGERRTIESLHADCGIGHGYRKLLLRWLQRPVSEGVLERHQDEYLAVAPLTVPDISALAAEAQSFFGSDHILLDYLIACGSQLTEIITGRLSPLETLFPGGEFARAEEIYEHAPLSSYFAGIARAALEPIVRVSPGSALRVVEIGAGTGATTSALLPVLSGRDAEYHFTDVSDIFLRHAAQKFAAWPFVQYGLLNIEKPGADSKYRPGSFDVVVATNVLHATVNLDATLRNVRSLLAPGGFLILNEVTTYLPWFDITTGLIEGWQSFEDDRRSDHPLLSALDWEKALAEAGFDRTFGAPAEGAPGSVLGQHVIVARAPGTQIARVAVTTAAQAAAALPDAGDCDWVARLADAASEFEKAEILSELARTEIAGVLRLNSPESLDPRRRLIDLGLDSLMAVELRNRLAKVLRLESPLPATLVFDHPTIEALAQFLHSRVFERGPARVDTADRGQNGKPDNLAQRIENMSEADAEALLLEKLKAL
jgi:SAM-dependent methyltransferase/aryl carrier-like protein